MKGQIHFVGVNCGSLCPKSQPRGRRGEGRRWRTGGGQCGDKEGGLGGCLL